MMEMCWREDRYRCQVLLEEAGGIRATAWVPYEREKMKGTDG